MESSYLSNTPRRESVWDYPRPPRIEAETRKVTVQAGGQLIAQSDSALRVLETSHPPTIYIPFGDVADGVLAEASGTSFCEWKGRAVYWDVMTDSGILRSAAWSYPDPSTAYGALRDHISFYPERMDACFLGNERVTPQPGDFYGGWITSEIVGPFKGGPGTTGW